MSPRPWVLRRPFRRRRLGVRRPGSIRPGRAAHDSLARCRAAYAYASRGRGERAEASTESRIPARQRVGDVACRSDTRPLIRRASSGLTGSLKGLVPKDSDLLADVDTSRTAIYDITSHTVYLPNGRRLEAHSGLGSHMDDPRSVAMRNIGVTPPNVYDLKMRESLFHGVRAIRLIPKDDSKMYGRAGILAHSYMLGPNGQSNGCVSFSDYSAFLDAYLRGDVTRLVVVEHLASAYPRRRQRRIGSPTRSRIFSSDRELRGAPRKILVTLQRRRNPPSASICSTTRFIGKTPASRGEAITSPSS